MLAILKAVVTFGPTVIDLIGDLFKAIQDAKATKDRKKAERVIFMKMWCIQHNIEYKIPE